jgi:hypothetical protein
LLGVALSQFGSAGGSGQLSLLEPSAGAVEAVESERDLAIARVIDQVRDKFGNDALGRGGADR